MKKFSKKGFTLIELLAVIIILAVIALIATPIILNVVDNAKESARQSSVSGYADATRLAVTEYQFGHGGETPTLDQAFIDTIKPQGSTVTCEDVIYSNDYGVVLNKCNVVPDTKEYCFASGKTYTDCTNQEFQDIYNNLEDNDNGYTGVPNVDYNPGQVITYADLKWKVMSDNGDSITLILANDYMISAYGLTSNWAASVAYQKVTTDFVDTYSKIEKDIVAGGIVYDSFSNSYVRLPKFEEASTNIANDSNNYFWTMSPSGGSQKYLSPNGTVTVDGYTIQDKTVYLGYGSTAESVTKKVPICNSGSTYSDPTKNQIEIITNINSTMTSSFYASTLSQIVPTNPPNDTVVPVCHGNNKPIPLNTTTAERVYYADGNNSGPGCRQIQSCSIVSIQLVDVSLRPVITVKKS